MDMYRNDTCIDVIKIKMTLVFLFLKSLILLYYFMR